MSTRIRNRAAALLVLGAACVTGCQAGMGETRSEPATAFQVDPFYPAELPDGWIIGQVSGLAVDERDHVWIVHRPASLTPLEAGAVQDPPPAMCCVPAPPVIEFDPEGNVVRSWGGPGPGYEWPESEHGIHVDHLGHVWIGGNGPEDNQVLKFTRDGEFLLQIGVSGRGDGSNDPHHLAGPAAMEVDAETNEIYITDGYRNRRVIVFDAETGEYRRHWGAYGDTPDDAPLGPYDPDAPPARQFRTPVHGVAIAADGLVYIADRPNNRIQVFRKDGTFVDEAFIRPATRSMGSVWDVALSRDPGQRHLYVPDGVNKTVWIVDRASLEVVGNFGRGGRWAGQLGWVHNAAVDSRGNVYVSEVETSKRFQKFEPVDGDAPGIEPVATDGYHVTDGWAKLPEGREWGAVIGVHPDAEGNLWVFERCGANSCIGSDLDPILKFDRNGDLVTSFGAGLFAWPHGFFLDHEGHLWVTDAVGFGGTPEGLGHQVFKLSQDGEILLALGTAGVAGEAETLFDRPNDVVVSPEGYIFITDGHGVGGNNRVVKYAPDGSFVKAWGRTGTGPGEFRDPHAIAMDSQGRIFVGDRANNRIQIFDQEGEFIHQWTQFGRPSGIFIDADDVIYVADSESNATRNPGWKRGIRIGSARTGWASALIEDPEPDPDDSPTSGAEYVAADADGRIYAAEVGPRNLRIYEPIRRHRAD